MNILYFHIKAMKCLYERAIVTMALYGAEAWGTRSAESRKVNVLEMKCLRSSVGVSRMDRVRNEEMRRRAGIERELESRADHRVLRWFCHVKRTNEYSMARRVLITEVSGGRVRRRPRLGWMDEVKVASPYLRRVRWRLRDNARKTGKSGEPWNMCS